ncbi:MAG: PKD domain-containing protein, partial [Bacteroidota bacterium]
IVNTINGCKDTLIKVDSVLVGFHVTPSFTISDDTVCYHDPIQFTFNTPGANSWTWIFGDGGMDSLQQNPIHIYGDTGTFTVTLVACNNGCCDTLIIPHMVTIVPPKAQFSVASSCITPYKVTCTNSSAGADSIVWNFHDGSPLVSNTSPVNHTYATRGIKSITIYAFNFATGCEDSMLISYQVTDPIAGFKIIPLTGCYPLIVTITDTSQDANSHFWSFGDANTYTTSLVSFGYTYYTPGLFTVKEIITDIHGCTDSITKPNYIHTYGPLPGFTANKDSGCAPLSVIFSDTSHSEFPIVSRIWSFGDGVIDTVTTTIISHIYMNPGSYTVTLTVKDSQGCIKTITIPNYIRASLPIASFVVDTFSCPGKVVSFNAAASIAAGGSYHWAFGDGNTFVTTLNTATHTYAANGNYTATLTLIDQNGCDSAVSHPIHIESPVANFSDSALLTCGNAQVTFYNLSTGTALTAAYWNFGNGGTSVSMGTTFNNYVNPGYYTVSLIMTNAAGCSSTASVNVMVN